MNTKISKDIPQYVEVGPQTPLHRSWLGKCNLTSSQYVGVITAKEEQGKPTTTNNSNHNVSCHPHPSAVWPCCPFSVRNTASSPNSRPRHDLVPVPISWLGMVAHPPVRDTARHRGLTPVCGAASSLPPFARRPCGQSSVPGMASALIPCPRHGLGAVLFRHMPHGLAAWPSSAEALPFPVPGCPFSGSM